MTAARSNGWSGLATLLLLGRVSNLPTVWSNCLAGWLVAGGGEVRALLWLSLGATFLYLGGTYLNDAFDAQFDAQHRRERPIPSGRIQVETVWIWGLSWLALGLIVLAWFSKSTVILAVLLALNILIYDAVHKIFAFSPVFMAGCRFLLVLMAASVGPEGINGLSIWTALVMASYVAGLSYLARKESIRTPVRYWPTVLLVAPAVLALVVNQGDYQLRSMLVSALLVVWILSCLRYTYWSAQRNVGYTAAGLLAGIVLVDWLAVAGGAWPYALVFPLLFSFALVLQRVVPAT